MKLAHITCCAALICVSACASGPYEPGARPEIRRDKGVTENWRVWKPTPGSPDQQGGLPLPPPQR